jgi:hypothetical protein
MGQPRHPRARTLVERLSAIADGAKTAVLLEAKPRLGLAAAGPLLERGWAVAPLYGRWPAEGAVLPTDRVGGWLLSLAQGRAPGAHAAERGRRALCLLLDAERERRVSARTLRRRFDNRYAYLAHVLPPAPRFTEWGVQRVVWAGATANVAADLAGYVESVVQAGVAVEVARLVPASERRRSGGVPR